MGWVVLFIISKPILMCRVGVPLREVYSSRCGDPESFECQGILTSELLLTEQGKQGSSRNLMTAKDHWRFSCWTCGGLFDWAWSLSSPYETGWPAAPMHARPRLLRRVVWEGISHYAASQIKCHSCEWRSNWIETAILEVWLKPISPRLIKSVVESSLVNPARSIMATQQHYK